MKPKGGGNLNRILAALLALAVIILVIIVAARTNGADAVLHDNYIRTERASAKHKPTPSTNATLELYRANAAEAYAFSVDNMFPGDTTEKTFTINVSHSGGVTLYFSAALQSGTDAILADGLCISVTRSGELLYDGPFSLLPGPMACTLEEHSSTISESVPFTIKVYLPTSAGNEFQNKTLVADLQWWVEDIRKSDSGGDSSDKSNLSPWISTPDGKPDIPKMIAQTGDNFPLILLIIIALAALAGFIILMLFRKKEGRHGRKP